MKIEIYRNGKLLQTLTPDTNVNHIEVDMETGQVSEYKYFPHSESDALPQDLSRNACDTDMIECLRAAQKRFLKDISNEDYIPDWDALTSIVNAYRILAEILAGGET